MRKEPGQISLHKIRSFSNLLDELTALEKLLPGSEVKHFMVFNKAYHVVMRDIKNAAASGYFENPGFIEKFSIQFARFYFTALNKTMNGDKDIPSAWEKLNIAAKHKATPNFIALLMGANAHINRDLSLVLLKLMDKEPTDDLLKDVFKLDKLLMKAGREIIGLFDEPNRVLNFMKSHLVFLYYRPTMYMVLFWRVRAWQAYKRLKKAGQVTSTYEKRSVTIANRFLKIAYLFSR